MRAATVSTTSIFALALTATSVVTVHSWSCDEGYDSETYDTLSIQWLGDVDELAVCNDGTEGAYYMKKSTTGSKTWLVYLGGGGMCYDAESCAARYDGTEYPEHDCATSDSSAPCFMSSKDYADTCGKTGIFDADPAKSPLSDANKVYLPYCTSDFHVGDIGVSDEVSPTFQFRGQRMVKAMINDLTASQGLTDGATLLFSGGSAGGRGAMAWLDAIPMMVPKGVKVLGLLDSGYYLDIESYTSDFSPDFMIETDLITTTMNGTSLVHAASKDCAAAYPGDQMWKCMYGTYRMPFVTTPYLMTAAQYDGWQLSHDVHAYAGIESDPVYTDDELLYVNTFGSRTQAMAKTLPSQLSTSASIYSPACYNHHITEQPNFWLTSTDENVTQNDALTIFLKAGGEGVNVWIDECEGYECGKGC
mmetsp:Transcript_32389/g.85087  ORF Transcript_32389/g.85087 Transcript_32389/m.85087 type:complete len:418 (-) Transcript_32389:112-1365(-)|eukprot:CAMPEP_0119535156 /NCGR_PEP_ID=MMETSP1344-20130328/48249_1 /TAXON_ID=236787 /ORGANISM="Florenciella parvula, Strain CCMP2471" /LENGTH=417 /DNA_ID=CAMNT_0007576655 /DNA_START=183 /DNA_END=1436 /DNA_ORIENTATION=+